MLWGGRKVRAVQSTALLNGKELAEGLITESATENNYPVLSLTIQGKGENVR